MVKKKADNVRAVVLSVAAYPKCVIWKTWWLTARSGGPERHEGPAVIRQDGSVWWRCSDFTRPPGRGTT